MSRFGRVRSLIGLMLVVVVALVAGVVIEGFENHADASRRAQTEIKAVEFDLAALQTAPFVATPDSAGSPSFARHSIAASERSLTRDVGGLMLAGSVPPALQQVLPTIRRAEPAVQQIYEIGIKQHGYIGPRVARFQSVLSGAINSAIARLTQASRTYSIRAADSRRVAKIGSFAIILGLLAMFGFFYRRSVAARLAAEQARAAAEHLSLENARLLDASRDEAVTDPLTGLGNRRAFQRDLEAILPTGGVIDGELLVAMFDLDGFKQYNDTFGHHAGDALLSRLSGCLAQKTIGVATAYRMGGDEFCLIAQIDDQQGQELVDVAVDALSDSGEGWEIGCSWGVTRMPSEADTTSHALRIADERMYAQKASRASASYQATAALVQVLAERDLDLSAHTTHVTHLATQTAHQLGLPEHEIIHIAHAAQLHDIGKTAVPESILSKPGALDDEEWAFIHRHTVIGERIIAAAPSLAPTAKLVRSTHERVDGDGYPDGLRGDQIPLGARIITACDAFDAMTTDRAYRPAMSPNDAISELHRCAGTHFDPAVVDALCLILTSRAATVAQG